MPSTPSRALRLAKQSWAGASAERRGVGGLGLEEHQRYYEARRAGGHLLRGRGWGSVKVVAGGTLCHQVGVG